VLELKELYELKLQAKEPFDLNLTLSCYSFNWWFNGRAGVIPLLEEPMTVAVVSGSNLEVEVKVFGVEQVDVEKQLRWILGLDEDLSDFYSKVERDPLLREVPKTLRGMRMRALSPWNALLVAICQQNASFMQGWRMLSRIYKLLGAEVNVEGLKTIIPPGPGKLLSDDAKVKLREAGAGYRAEVIVEAAKRAREGLLKEASSLSPSRAEDVLREVKGIGSYTARLTLVLSMRMYELLPLDRWLKRLAEEVYGVEDAEKELKARWGRWCGLATYFTTVVLDAEVISEALRRALSGEVKPKPYAGRPTPLTMWMHEWR